MYSIIDLKVMGDSRGSLVAVENQSQIPFDIKRVFYVYDTTNEVPRGCHANRKSHLLLIAVSGSCKVKIRHKNESIDVELNNKHTGLYLEPMVWKEMYDFSDDAVLLVMASELYDQNEYINDYDKLMEELENA